MRYSIPLQANAPVRLPVRGRSLAVVSTGAASVVGVVIHHDSQQDGEDFGAVGRAFNLRAEAPFFGVTLSVTVAATVEIIVTDSRIEVLDGANLSVTVVGSVSTVPANVTAANDAAPVAVTAAATLIAGANVSRRELILCNLDAANAVSVSPTGALTWAKRVIVLQPGDVYVVERGANLDWFGICDAGLTASVSRVELYS